MSVPGLCLHYYRIVKTPQSNGVRFPDLSPEQVDAAGSSTGVLTVTPSGNFEGHLMSVTHILKCWPEYITEIIEGRKLFEVRVDDRTPKYNAGQRLHLKGWNQKTQSHTWHSVTVEVLAVFRNLPGVLPGYVVMSIKTPEVADTLSPHVRLHE